MSNTRTAFPYNETWLRYAWRRWLARYDTGGVLLDYGCGIGVNGEILRGLAGRRVIGVDLDPGCLSASRARGLDVLQADLSQPLALRPGVADIVLLIHCLEHVEDGNPLLSSVAATLKPGGALVVVTPDWRQSFRDFFDDPTHRRPYTRAALGTTLCTAGFRVRVLLHHNVGYHLGRTPLWRLFPRLCFTGDALFAIAEREPGLDP